MNKIFRILIAFLVIFGLALTPLANHTVLAEEDVTPPVELTSTSGQAGTTLTATVIAEGYWKQVFDWDIQKTGPAGPFTFSTGQEFTLDYEVILTAAMVHEAIGVSGKVCVTNGGDRPTEGLKIVAQVEYKVGAGQFQPLTGADQTFTPAQLAAGEVGCYNYNVKFTPVAGAVYRLAAIVTITNHSGHLGEEWGPTPKADFSLPAAPVTQDACVTVTDTLYGLLGTVCASQSPYKFSYSIKVKYDVCGLYEVVNTASFVTENTKKSASDTWKVVIDVPCAGGCTLTPGYWKTHSTYGPAPYDATWALMGENTPFFLSGQSWYQVLWTSPSGGNAYYILAHAYIAARLNLLNDASSTPAVDAALARATTFFNTYTPSATLTKAVRNAAIADAGLLDGYNNGLTGPGHCDF